jgi:tetratricopeptide (TPR) repeat protein
LVRGGAYQAVAARLERFELSGDPQSLVEGQASEDLVALRSEIGWLPFGPMPDAAVIKRELDAVVLAGRFARARSHVLPGVDRLDALVEATELFAAVYPLAPGAVPGQAVGVCAAISGPGGVDYVGLHNDALDSLDEALARQDLQTVDQAIWQLAAAVLAARGDQAEPFFLTSLGTAWMDRFKLTGRADDVDHAITAHKRALAVPALLPEDQAGRQANNSSAVLARFELHGEMTDLSAAVNNGRATAQLARRTYADLKAGRIEHSRAGAVLRALHTALSNVAAALLASWEYRQDRPDLDEAVRVSREAAEATPAGDSMGGARKANLAQVLLERFGRFWQVADLEEAFQAAVAAGQVPASDLARAPCLSALAQAYANRFAYSGQLRDLEQAISVGRAAVEAAPDDHPGQAGCLSNLGGVLHRRYECFGDTDSLNEAIAMHQRAVRATPAGPRRARFLNNLGHALRSRFEATGRKPDISQSVAALDEAVATAGSHETDRAGYVANLALSLVMAAERGADPGAVGTAITILERELHALNADHPLRHVYLASLGNAWRARFDTTGDQEALRSAISWFERAADALPPAHPRRAELLANLGAVLMREFERTGNEETGRRALGVSRSATEIVTAPASTRALAARNWGQAAAGLGKAHEAMGGFAVAVGLLDTVAWQGLRRADQERQLGRFGALACDAAAWAVAAGDPERAVELLEQGRGVLLAQSLGERARHFDLQQADSGLAASLESIDRALEQLSAAADEPGTDTAVLASRLADLTSRREELLERIRELPGFADFLKPPGFASLRAAAAGGPVVIVNVSSYRCDALIVTTNGVEVRELADLTGGELVHEAAIFLGALVDLAKYGIGDDAITAVLGWLWDRIASPLIHDLRAAAACYGDGHGQRPCIWWCPTGPLTFLPLHAAGRHDVPGESVIDSFTSSYAPTLRLLQRTHQQAAPSGHSGPPLLVALPDTPGQSRLPAAEREADAFMKRFPGTRQLRGTDATAETTRQALTGCPAWTHFACHGTQDLSDPSAGHLALYDEPLTIGAISSLRLHGTELAFLSACKTSQGGADLSDEAITIATAFCLAGYRHVIGTLWSISDEHAPGVADEVYDILAEPGSSRINANRAAIALDTAVRALREASSGDPSLWASYIHIGP